MATPLVVREMSAKGDSSPQAKGVAVRPRILLVEKDMAFAWDIQNALGSSADIEHVDTTSGAMAELLRKPFDLLWIDLDQESFYAETDAVEAAAFIRLVREKISSDLPVVVMSANPANGMNSLLGSLAIEAFFSKPPDYTAVRTVLEKIRSGQSGRPKNGVHRFRD